MREEKWRSSVSHLLHGGSGRCLGGLYCCFLSEHLTAGAGQSPHRARAVAELSGELCNRARGVWTHHCGLGSLASTQGIPAEPRHTGTVQDRADEKLPGGCSCTKRFASSSVSKDVVSGLSAGLVSGAVPWGVVLVP